MQQTYFHEASGIHVGKGQAFTIDGTQYPPNWLDHASADEIAAIGLTPVTVVGTREDETYFDNAEVLDGATLTITATTKDAGTIKAIKWKAIKAERDRRTDNGGYEVGSKWFQSDQKSRSQQLGLVLLGTNIPANLQWKTMDGSFVTMTQQLAGQILAAGAASDQAIFAAAETHKAAMEASADPASYDYSGGWPKIYGE